MFGMCWNWVLSSPVLRRCSTKITNYGYPQISDTFKCSNSPFSPQDYILYNITISDVIYIYNYTYMTLYIYIMYLTIIIYIYVCVYIYILDS